MQVTGGSTCKLFWWSKKDFDSVATRVEKRGVEVKAHQFDDKGEVI